MSKPIDRFVVAAVLLAISSEVRAIQTDEQAAARRPSQRGPVIVPPGDSLSTLPRTNGVITLEALEQYVVDIADDSTVEVTRLKALLPGQIGTISCEDDIEDPFPGVHSCVTSKTIAGEAVRAYLEAKYILRHARARSSGGYGHLNRLRDEPARMGWNFPQPNPQLERMIEHANKRYERAQGVVARIERKVSALRSLILEYHWAAEEYYRSGRDIKLDCFICYEGHYLEFNLTPGVDFE
ncbi:MAG: hypothetical protein HYT79_09330 [Elusimicrobia bacterium]|nr:hypothetical protein [Elusimicrobiota bacterium]